MHCIKCIKIFYRALRPFIVVLEPGPALRMFSATFFSLLFPVSIYLGPSQVHTEHPQLASVWSQGPKNTFFGTCLWRNYVNVYNNSLKLHTLSYMYEIWHGVSWHIGVSSRIGFWCLLPLNFKISPTTSPETQKKCCPLDKFSSNMIIFKHFMVNITTSPVYRKLPTFISFNLRPRWSFYLENYCFCSQNIALYLKSEKIEYSVSTFTEAKNLTMSSQLLLFEVINMKNEY